MSLRLKTILLVIAAATGLGVIGVWYALASIDQAKLTKLIGATVKEATGRDLIIKGPIRLSFFPSIGLKAQDVSLSNASWATDPEMVNIQRLDLDIKLWPLFSRSVQINRINMSGLDVHLQANSAGASTTGNWILAVPLAQGGDSSSEASNMPGANSHTFVSINSVQISDARITYRNAQRQETIFPISNLSLKGNGQNTQINLEAKRGDHRLVIQGVVTEVRKILNDWGQRPLNMSADLQLELGDKTLLIKGVVDKDPQAIPRFNLDLSSKDFDLDVLAGASAVAASSGKLPKPSPKTSSPYYFSNTPLPLNLLPQADGLIHIQIEQLSLPPYAPLKNFSAALQFQPEQITLQNLRFQLGTGSAQAQGSIAHFEGSNPLVSLQGEAKGFTLEQALKSAKGSSQVSGGEAHLAFDLKSAGTSLHAWMANLNGKTQVTIDHASLPSSYINEGGDFIVSLFNAINPLRKNSNRTVLECVVAYLPVNQGLVSIANTIGVETDRLDVVLAGTLNLKDEAIHIDIFPREKSGLTTGLDLANLVQLQGTLQNPKTGINKSGVINSAVSIGLGFLTGGVSILAENAKSLATKSQPCKAALHSWSDIYSGS
ncbi:AsmA family protein [Polynucleobacter meluiroseus]|uniref:AsmA family protein n=1 Tax=Polynucleobacter meluiroseus TaxID=1938814 RepID=UPI001A9C42FA|nr:AsmA family protein [Polynucleobacter meluiroseus]